MIKTLFDNLNEFSANDFATLYSNLFNNGVIVPFADNTATTTALKVTNSNGNVAIGDGSAMINGRTIIVSGETVPLDTDGTYQIVLEWSAAADGATFKALSDTETLTQNSMFYQLPLALVVKSGASLTITDLRSFVNRISDTTANDLYNIINTGWVPITEVYPSLVFNYITGGYDFYLESLTDLRDKIKKGTKIKLTQTTEKYFIVVDIDSTTIALYGGTDYELTWDTISSAYCSNAKSPIGFPLDPDKWSITVIDTDARTQSAPVANTWYNVGNIKIILPAGLWIMQYQCEHFAQSSALADQLLKTTLSTSPTAETDKELTHRTSGYGSTVVDSCYKRKLITVSSITTYYLNLCTSISGVGSIGRNNGEVPAVLRALCAYL
jgi:hypothetical protein